MKQLLLKKLVLSNWKSNNVEIDFNEKTTKISGRNGIGKTSVVEAWNWLMSSYTDSNSSKNENLYDNRFPLTENTPVASVKAIIELDGYEYTIEKTAQAKFVRKRGSNEYEKAASDNYTIKIDDIETSATDFNIWIERNVCPVSMITYLLDGSFLSTLSVKDKNKARKTLETIVGEIKESDFQGDYSAINDKLKRYSIEEIKTQTKNSIKPLKRSEEDVQAAIENNEKTLAEFKKVDFDTLAKEIDEKNAKIKDIDNQILGKSESIKPIIAKRDEMMLEINSKLSKLGDDRIAYEDKEKAKISDIERQISNLNAENTQIKMWNDNNERMHKENLRSLDSAKSRLEHLSSERELLLKERDEVKELVFTEDTCPYCHQELPYDMAEENKKKFLEKKNEKLSIIVKKGKQVAKEIEDCKEQISNFNELVSKGYVKKEIIDCNDLLKRLDDTKSKYVPFEETDTYKETSKEIDDMRANMPSIPQGDNESLTREKETLMNELRDLNRQYGRKDDMDRTSKEIETLKKHKFEIGCEIAELEGTLDLILDYESERANIVSERVNEKLINCRIDMWSMLKSGEIVQDCVIKDREGVLYATTNNANKKKINIELQKLFCEHYDSMLPCFIDESSIFDDSNLPKLEGQAIYLFASNDNYLKVE